MGNDNEKTNLIKRFHNIINSKYPFKQKRKTTLLETVDITSYSRTNCTIKAKLYVNTPLLNMLGLSKKIPLGNKVVKFYTKSGKQLQVSKDDKLQPVEGKTDLDGAVCCTYRRNSIGKGKLYARFEGDDTYLPTTADFTIDTKEPINTYIEYIGDAYTLIGNPITFKAKVYYLDENNKKQYLKNRMIRFKAFDKLLKEVPLDSNGVAMFDFESDEKMSFTVQMVSYRNDYWDKYAKCVLNQEIIANLSLGERDLLVLLKGQTVNVGIFGCCISRAIFNSSINNHYKKFFNLALDSQRSSYVSLIQPPVEHNKDDLLMPTKNKSTDYDYYCLGCDLSKKFFEDLKTANLEYLLIDLEWEVNHGILKATLNDEDIIISNNANYYQTKFNELLKNKEILDIKVDTEKYFKLWKNACDKLFERINSMCPNLKIVIVPAKQTYVYKTNGGLEVNHDAKGDCDKSNALIRKLEDYILNNYDVIRFEQPEVIGDPNHIFGKNKVHYTKDFYNSIYDQLIDLVCEDKVLSATPNH